MQTHSPRIAVIGGGVIGLAIARSLAQLGAAVTILERSRPGAGTSSTSFAWVNSNGKAPASYHRLNCAGMAEHAVLQQRAGSEARWFDACGTFEWAADAAGQQRLDERVRKLQALDYPAAEVSPGFVRARIPEWRIASHAGPIWHFPSEGLLDPAILMAYLWSDARASGAVLHQQAEVLEVNERADGVSLRLAAGEAWNGDFCVLATGRWTARLVASLGIGLAMVDAERRDRVACGFLASTDPQLVQLRSNLIGPDLNVRPDGGGRLLLQAVDLDDQADPANPPAPDSEIGREMLRRLHGWFDNTAHARIERLVVGQRSRPADGLPAIGFLTPRRRAYVAATHSGMTLGPLLGRLVAEELVHERRDALLADFAPDRLLNRDPGEFSPIASIHFPAEQ
ncbi:NAD(P)/FAD-dependent oxidoreductase [Burkholderia perseverans]|uniref:NAD(P)/FAD-dependent oxidoreductase n=1 Tax=Burkholderia perseverans TaxID=2615214 RepID=UPI001FEF2592|nr:FAD-dependent oxidoreductase [Burkholderia perseverans]